MEEATNWESSNRNLRLSQPGVAIIQRRFRFEALARFYNSRVEWERDGNMELPIMRAVNTGVISPMCVKASSPRTANCFDCSLAWIQPTESARKPCLSASRRPPASARRLIDLPGVRGEAKKPNDAIFRILLLDLHPGAAREDADN